LRIIPVIDILNGIVVHARKGKRSQYQPLKSIFCNSANPLILASKLAEYNFNEVYIADLDAILSKGENIQIIKEIVEKTNLSLFVDAGINNLHQAQRLFDNKVTKIIIGTETLLDLNFIKTAISCFGANKIIVSLDLCYGKIISKSPEIASMDPIELAKELEKFGILEIIILDLKRVGSQEGVDISFLEKLTKQINLKILVGGGVRSQVDLKKINQIGINGVLIATALYKGTIDTNDVKKT